ncbi:MAG: SH3 domain-containing protein [Myxococcota bacterium]|nr:SH3 domain-containing protein [Myxococcota bacterium]
MSGIKEKPMDAQKTTSHAGSTRASKQSDRSEVIKVLIIAITSFLLGFGLVILFFKPTTSSSATNTAAPLDEVPSAAHNVAPAVGRETTAGDRYAPPDPISAGAGEAEAQHNGPLEGDAPPEVPPGRTPAGVMLDGEGFYLKCWDRDGKEIPGTRCDRLRILEKRFSTRLYVVDDCKKKQSNPDATGKLSLGVEVDFEKKSLSFWNGASSDIEGAADIATCLRTALNGLPIHGFIPKYERYRIFFSVLFGISKDRASQKKPDKQPTKLRKGKMVDVVKNHVRVRESPKDGRIIGKISSGSQVKLLQKKGDWCRVITPNNNEGWMICDALGD